MSEIPLVRLGIATWDALFVAASLAVDRQENQQAATLLGLAKQTWKRTRGTLVDSVRELVDAVQATVRAALGPATFAQAYVAGQQMTLADAFTTLLAQTSP